MTPALTFVIPAWNAERTLGDTLASMRNQTVDCEAIVVDDGSTDQTAAVAGSFGVRLVRQANTGLASARLTGLAHATANAVCFLDADDVVRPSFADRMIGMLGSHDLCACAHQMAGPGLEDLGWTSTPGSTDTTVVRMLGVNPFVVGAVVMRRDVFERFGVAFDRTLPVHEDWDLWIRLTSAGASWAPIVEAPLFVYRLRDDSMSCDLDLMWRVGLRVIGKSGAGLPEQNDARRRWTLRSLARAIARGDRALAGGLISFLSELSEADVGLLAASVRWALQREEIVGPSGVGARAPAWRTRIRSTVDERLAMRVLALLDLTSRDWTAMARSVLALLGPRDRIVVYGLGRNGRSLLSALCARPEFAGAAYIDDDPEARATGAKRIGINNLTSHDLVIVAPDDHGDILKRLHAHERVLTLAELAPRARASA